LVALSGNHVAVSLVNQTMVFSILALALFSFDAFVGAWKRAPENIMFFGRQ